MGRYSEEEQKETKARRDKAHQLKEQIQALIHPNPNYICYFMDAYPQWKNKKDIIRRVWNGIITNQEVNDMMEYIIITLTQKKVK